MSSVAIVLGVDQLLQSEQLYVWLYRQFGGIRIRKSGIRIAITITVSWITFLYILYTAIAVGIKRLADTNRKGWEVSLVLIPLIDFTFFGIGSGQLIGVFMPIDNISFAPYIHQPFIYLGINRFHIGIVITVILYFLSPFCVVYISIVCGFLTPEIPNEVVQRNWAVFIKRLLLVVSIIAFCVGFWISIAIGNYHAIGFGFWSVWLVWGIYGIIRWIYSGLLN